MISAPLRSGTRLPTKLLASLGAAALSLTLFGSAMAAADPGPFDGLAGRWAGTGVVTYSDGTKERLQCSVKYDQNETDSISQSLSCTSDSYNFKINAYYKYQADSLVGHWSELVLQISGSLTGTVVNGRITGNLHGPGFQARAIVDTKGDRQTVTISAPEQRISQVAIAVKKSGN
ncbi:MAG: hypothetical protein WDM84_02655 [Bauldia sp.]